MYLHKLVSWIKKAHKSNWRGSYSDIGNTRYTKYCGVRVGRKKKRILSRVSLRSIGRKK